MKQNPQLTDFWAILIGMNGAKYMGNNDPQGVRSVENAIKGNQSSRSGSGAIPVSGRLRRRRRRDNLGVLGRIPLNPHCSELDPA